MRVSLREPRAGSSLLKAPVALLIEEVNDQERRRAPSLRGR
jgi:hypothetical protein